jgi:uncharacterized membrane protein YfcA
MIYFIVSLLASVIGAVCGIGGGVIIKPALDMLGVGSVVTVTFLSGCTVLAMSGYSVAKNTVTKEIRVNGVLLAPLVLGAAAGGVAGKVLFNLAAAGADSVRVAAVQSSVLLVLTAVAFVFFLNIQKIKPLCLLNRGAHLAVGLTLGIVSAFLGIGGGPINIVVLFFLFGADLKTAAMKNLYLVFFSQTAALIYTLISQTVPDFDFIVLILMITAGILGGIVGRFLQKKLSDKGVRFTLCGLILYIIVVCIYNIVKAF